MKKNKMNRRDRMNVSRVRTLITRLGYRKQNDTEVTLLKGTTNTIDEIKCENAFIWIERLHEHEYMLNINGNHYTITVPSQKKGHGVEITSSDIDG